MEEFLNIDVLIVALSAMAAAGSFVAVVIPLMNRSERKERVRSVIEKKRKVLFEQTREQATKGYKPDDKTLSASESVAASFKMKRLLGEMGEKSVTRCFRRDTEVRTRPLNTWLRGWFCR